MSDTTPLHPELTAPALDAVAVSYRAAGDVLNGGTHAVRALADAPFVTGEQLAARVDALDYATSALLIALSTLRDSPGAGLLADQLQHAVDATYTAGQHLTTVGRLLGPAGPEDDE